MMGAGNDVGNARSARESPFEKMFDAVLGLATGVLFVFVTRRRIGFPHAHSNSRRNSDST